MSLHPFDMQMELPTEAIRLDCAALHLARDVYGVVNLFPYLEQIDGLAAEVFERRAGLTAPLRYEAMREVLVERHDFRGNSDDYYDPENSYFNRVLERSRGIPITLSILWIEVARRLKWPVSGVGFPGHFLVRFDDAEHYVLVDPFRDGQSLNIDDCRKILSHHFEGKVEFKPEFLEPVDARSTLVRLLNNLRSIYLVNHDWGRLDDVLQRLAAVEPENSRHREELAALRYRQGDVRSAYAHLSSCLTSGSDTDERVMVQKKLRHLEAAIAALN
jgi:regulator of sirC expression with transglutaminase-like and TPR domain